MKARLRCAVLTACLVTAVGIGMEAAQAAPVTATAVGASTGGLHPSSAAEAAGISRPGQAYMGWSMRGETRQKHGAAQGPAAPTTASTLPKGVDVSAWNAVDWPSLYSNGTRFAYIKATEGDYYKSATFSSQYAGARKAGIIRGAYHFANPSVSSGASQADYFVAHGGGWSADGWTLPGALDIEYNPYKKANDMCYGLTPGQMTSWIASFTTRYKALTGHDAVIYSINDWWTRCTGNTTRFSRTNPLWIAWYGSNAGTMPGGWNLYTFWQYGTTPVDQDLFNGPYSRLRALAAATPSCGQPPFSDVPAGSQFCWQINSLKSRNIVGGYPDGGFRPATSVSRQAFAHFLYQSWKPGQQDGPCTNSQSQVFSDVPQTSQFCKSITALSQQSITTGYANGTFRPGASISRQAIAAMIYRAYNVVVNGNTVTDASCTMPSPFKDVDARNTFCGDIEFMHRMGLSDGYADGDYHPAAYTSRQAIAAFIYQYDYAVSIAG